MSELATNGAFKLDLSERIDLIEGGARLADIGECYLALREAEALRHEAKYAFERASKARDEIRERLNDLCTYR